SYLRGCSVLECCTAFKLILFLAVETSLCDGDSPRSCPLWRILALRRAAMTVGLNQVALKDFAASHVSPKQSQPRCPKTRSPHLAPFIARKSWLEALFGIKGELRH